MALHIDKQVAEKIENYGLYGERAGPGRLSVNLAIIQTEYVKRTKDGKANADDLHKTIAGVRKYLDLCGDYEKYCGGKSCYEIGESQLLHYPAQKSISKNVALVVVPSLINKHNILDLTPAQSFCQAAAKYGYDCYLIDWGSLAREDKDIDIDSLVKKKLCGFLKYIAKKHNKIFAAGYCLGGTILAASYDDISSYLSGMIMMAAPVDFKAGDSDLRTRIIATRSQAENLMLQHECLPNSWIQGLFAAMNVDRSMKKFADFYDYEEGSIAQKKFVAVENWLSEGDDLPQNIARHCLDGWYRDNALIRTIKNNSLPSFIVASRNDKIVPFQSSCAYADMCSEVEIWEVDKGHVGMMAGNGAHKKVWNPVFLWMARKI